MAAPRRLSELPGWQEDGLEDALAAYTATAPAGWPRPSGEARSFFESAFRPERADDGLLTGYFEPEMAGSLTRTRDFGVPLFAPPPGLIGDGAGPDRRQILREGLAEGSEIAWVADALDAYLAQVQGSARIRLAGGGLLRLGFAAKNGHPYRSIGAELIRRGAVAAGDMSVQAIRAWCDAHPADVEELLFCNPSFAFFRALDLPGTSGPLGACGVPVTPMRTIAADLTLVAPGTPVWLESFGSERLRRLVLVQDAGAAITGAGRADLFVGSGSAAGERAGRLREACRLTRLVPR